MLYQNNYLILLTLFLMILVNSAQVTSADIDTATQKTCNSTPISLAAVANQGFSDEISDDQKGGWTDQGADNDLRTFPVGNRQFKGVDFTIINPDDNNGKSCIALKGTERPYFPESVTLDVPQVKGKYLYLLSALGWAKPGKVGEITVEYDGAVLVDTEVNTFTVTCGQETDNFWGPQFVTNAEVAWTGLNPSANVAMYLTAFELGSNPIRKITLTSSGQMVWLIAGLSVSDRPPQAIDAPKDLIFSADDKYMNLPNSFGIAPDSVLDFSASLDVPAGKYGFLQATDDYFHFANRHEKVRFYGTNIVGDVHFMTNEQIDQTADELAATGYNLVRFHHFDQHMKAANEKSTVIDASKQDRLDYWIAACKKRGIYLTLDLFTIRRLGKGEIPEYPDLEISREFKALMFVNDAAMANIKEYAVNLLTHVNPYTNLSWLDEPAICMLSLINENTIYSTIERTPWLRQLYDDKFIEWTQTNNLQLDTQNRQFLWEQFLIETYLKAYHDLSGFIRELGVKIPLTDQNFWTRIPLSVMRNHYDYVDNHFYFNHPSYRGSGYGTPMIIGNASLIETYGGALTSLFAGRIFGKPFAVSEWNHCMPSSYSMQGVFFVGAYAALQDWDALCRFAHSHGSYRILNQPQGITQFDMANNPLRMLSERVGVNLYLRGDVAVSGNSFPLIVSSDLEDNGVNFDYPKTLARLGLISKVGTVVTAGKEPVMPNDTKAILKLQANFVVPQAADRLVYNVRDANLFAQMAQDQVIPAEIDKLNSSIYKSDTGEIELNNQDNIFTVITSKSEAFLLGIDSSAQGKFVQVRNYLTNSGVFVSAVDNKELIESKRILLLHLTDCKAADLQFRGGDLSYVEKLGSKQLLICRGKVELEINRDLADFTCYAVDMQGNRIAKMQIIANNDGKAKINLETDHNGVAVIAYELVRE